MATKPKRQFEILHICQHAGQDYECERVNVVSTRVTAPCVWKQDEDGNWDTGCDNRHVLIEGGPSENRMRYCCYCGAMLREDRTRR